MKAISIRQPWAWLILHGGKDIENRGWSTNFRGRILIHAAKGMTLSEYYDAAETAIEIAEFEGTFPMPEELERGGIVGEVTITHCVEVSESPWFSGPFGFVLSNPISRPFVPIRGALGIFEVMTPPEVTFLADQ